MNKNYLDNLCCRFCEARFRYLNETNDWTVETEFFTLQQQVRMYLGEFVVQYLRGITDRQWYDMDKL